MAIEATTLKDVGKFQWCAVLLLSFTCAPGRMDNIGILFLAPDVDYKCRNSTWFDEIESLNLSLKHSNDLQVLLSQLTSNLTKCQKPDFLTYSHESRTLNYTQCMEFDFDRSLFDSTVTEKFDLTCDKEWIRPFLSTVYMLGFFVGGLVCSILSDTYGRKFVLISSLLLNMTADVVAALSPTLWLYCVARFFTAVVGITYSVCTILMMEILKKDQRILATVTPSLSFVIGTLALAGVSLVVKTYVYLHYFIASITLITIVLNGYFIPESPRWLASRNRLEDADKILQRIAKFNNQKVDDLQYLRRNDGSEQTSTVTFFDLVRTPMLRRRTLLIWLMWFTIVFLSSGIMYNLGEFSENVKYSVMIAACTDIPACLLLIVTLNRFGRQVSLFLHLVVSGLCCLAMIPFVDDISSPWLLTFALIVKMLSSNTMFYIYQLTPELYPTVIRTIGTGTGSTIGRFGGMIAPMVVVLNVYWAPYLVVILGSFTLLAVTLLPLLPDTTGHELAQTIDDGEKFLAEHTYKLVLPPNFKCCGREWKSEADGEEGGCEDRRNQMEKSGRET